MRLVAVSAFAAVAMTGCSGEGLDSSKITLQSEFQDQAEILLQANGFQQYERMDYEYFDGINASAILEYGVTGAEGKGVAKVSCSAKEILHQGTHCMLGSLKLEGG